MNKKSIFSAVCALVFLAGCATDTKSTVPPSDEFIMSSFKNAYLYQNRKKAVDPVLHSVVSREAFPWRPDWFACLTVTQKTDGQVYNAKGKLLSDVGEDYRALYALLLREYKNDGWGVGILRQLQGNVKIGTLPIHQICDPTLDTDPWDPFDLRGD